MVLRGAVDEDVSTTIKERRWGMQDWGNLNQ